MADLIRRLGGLLGEILDLGRHDGKSPAGFAGTRRFDRGIEREQIGLARDLVDQLDDVPDGAGIPEQRLHHRIAAIRLRHGLLRNVRGLGDLTADFGDLACQLLRGCGHGLHIGGSFLGRCRDRGRLRAGFLGGRRDLRGGRLQLRGG